MCESGTIQRDGGGFTYRRRHVGNMVSRAPWHATAAARGLLLAGHFGCMESESGAERGRRRGPRGAGQVGNEELEAIAKTTRRGDQETGALGDCRKSVLKRWGLGHLRV